MSGLNHSDLKKILHIFKQFNNINDVILFGSRAKGNYKNGSDIDLAIVGEGIDFNDLCKISAQLDELDLPYKIDVIDFNAITNEELKIILSESGNRCIKKIRNN